MPCPTLAATDASPKYLRVRRLVHNTLDGRASLPENLLLGVAFGAEVDAQPRVGGPAALPGQGVEDAPAVCVLVLHDEHVP